MFTINTFVDSWEVIRAPFTVSSELELYKRVLNQKKDDKHKVYSLHEPEVECIFKGKEAKKYEFGNKA